MQPEATNNDMRDTTGGDGPSDSMTTWSKWGIPLIITLCLISLAGSIFILWWKLRRVKRQRKEQADSNVITEAVRGVQRSGGSALL
ncbi:MAG: hypothetical protein M1840_007602 [Geoglossum simile]|nr:MAG: hypothetical protein M1840_007602 [Geoglossum simile]